MSQKNEILSQALNKVLAETYALYLKTQNYHWNITGPNFHSLHVLFEEHYKEQAESIDEVAEQIRVIGPLVVADLDFFAKSSTAPKPNHQFSEQEMLKDLVKTQEGLIKDYRKMSDLAADHDNKSLEDFCVSRIQLHEKQRWMLASSL